MKLSAFAGVAALFIVAACCVILIPHDAPVELEAVDDAAVQAMRDIDHKLEMQAHKQLRLAKRSDALAQLHSKKAMTQHQLEVVAAAKQRELKLKAEVAAALVKEKQAHAALESVKHKESLLQRQEEEAEKMAQKDSHEIDVKVARIQRLKDKQMQLEAHADAEMQHARSTVKEVSAATSHESQIEQEIAKLKFQASQLQKQSTAALKAAAKSETAATELRKVAKEHAMVAVSLQKKMKKVLNDKAKALRRYIHTTKRAALLVQESAAKHANKLFQIAGSKANGPATTMLEDNDRQMSLLQRQAAMGIHNAPAHAVALESNDVTISNKPAAAVSSSSAPKYQIHEDPAVKRAAEAARVDIDQRRVRHALVKSGAPKSESVAVLAAAKREAMREAALADSKVRSLQKQLDASRKSEQAEKKQMSSMMKRLAKTESKLHKLVQSANTAALSLRRERKEAAASQRVLEDELRLAHEKKRDQEQDDLARKYIADATDSLAEDFAADAKQLLAEAASGAAVAGSAAAAASASAPQASTGGAAAGGSAASAAEGGSATAASASASAQDEEPQTNIDRFFGPLPGQNKQNGAAASGAASAGGSSGGAEAGSAGSGDESTTNADDFDPLKAFDDFLHGQPIDQAVANGVASGAASVSAASAEASGGETPETNADRIFAGGAPGHAGSDDVVTNADVLDRAPQEEQSGAAPAAAAKFVKSNRVQELAQSATHRREPRIVMPDPRSVKMDDAQGGVGMHDLHDSTNFEAANDFLDSETAPSAPDRGTEYFANSIEYGDPRGGENLLETGAEAMTDEDGLKEYYARSGYQDSMATANMLAYEHRVQDEESVRD